MWASCFAYVHNDKNRAFSCLRLLVTDMTLSLEEETTRMHLKYGKARNKMGALNMSEFSKTGKCQNFPKPENVRIWKCQNLSKLRNVRIRKCRNVSKGENVRIRKIYSKESFPNSMNYKMSSEHVQHHVA